MATRTTRIVLLAVVALATSVAGFAQCGLPNEIYCQAYDGSGNLYASQNDTVTFGTFAVAFDDFTLTKTLPVDSFHFVGGYFNGGPPPFVSDFTLDFYSDNAGVPGNPIFSSVFANFNETLIGGQIYSYDLYFRTFFFLGPGTYWASIVPDLPFPPQWGWATSAAGNGLAYQCFFGTCGTIGSTNFAFALDAAPPIPEPGTLIMLGTGVLGLAATLRRKLL